MMTEGNVTLVVIDLFRELEFSRIDKDRVEDIVNETLDRCGVTRAENVSTRDNGEGTFNEIMRFVRIQDRFIAFNSILLKSYFYHQVRQKVDKDDEQHENTCYPIVSLPRTTDGKPFIPSFNSTSDEKKCREYPIESFNISHQYPFIGMVYNSKIGLDCNLGLDIVTFDSINKALYATVTDFLNVYKSNFTKGEWDCIQYQRYKSCCTKVLRPDNWRMWEFYVRWAMKEAYTKALGKGMKIAFSSFQIEVSDVEGSCLSLGIWEFIMMRHQDYNSKNNQSKEKESFLLKTQATIHHIKGEKVLCDFIFIPLSSAGILHNVFPTTSKVTLHRFGFDGCACICSKITKNRFEENGVLGVEFKSITMQDLQNFHEVGIEI